MYCALQEEGSSVGVMLQRDAFLAFRALCRLSMRSADSATGLDPPALRGKVRVADVHKHDTY